MILKAFKINNNKVVRIDNRANETFVNLSKNNKSRNSTYLPNISAINKSIFITPNAKKAFKYLKQAFIKTLIFQHFDLEIISGLKLIY